MTKTTANEGVFRLKLQEITEGIQELLLEKNKRYGNAALEPKRIFYKGESEESILLRLDDKLSRMAFSDTPRLNDMVDIVGYINLWLISKGVKKEDILNLID